MNTVPDKACDLVAVESVCILLDGVGSACLSSDSLACLSLQAAVCLHFLLSIGRLALASVYRGEQEVDGWFFGTLGDGQLQIRQRFGVLAKTNQGAGAIDACLHQCRAMLDGLIQLREGVFIGNVSFKHGVC